MTLGQIVALLIAVALALAIAAGIDWRNLLAADGAQITGNSHLEPCLGCQQAMRRITSGEHCTLCPTCGCLWLDKETADLWNARARPVSTDHRSR